MTIFTGFPILRPNGLNMPIKTTLTGLCTLEEIPAKTFSTYTIIAELHPPAVLSLCNEIEIACI